MNDQVKMMLSGFFTAYESYKPLLDEAAFAPLAALREESLAMAEKNDDVMSFMQAATAAELFNRWTVALQQAGEAWQRQRKEKPREITLADFVRQYEVLRDDVKSRPHTERQQAAYARFLACADGAANPLVMMRRAEEGACVAAIAASGFEDTNQLMFDRADPNETTQRAYYAKCIELARDVRANEDLTYGAELAAAQLQQAASRDEGVRFALAMLFGRAVDFDKLKWTIRTHLKEAPNGLAKAPEHIGRFLHENGTALLIVRAELRHIWRLLTEDLGLTWEAIIGAPRWRKALLLGASVLPQTDRVWRGMTPANLEWLRETLFDEALSELPTAAILQRRPQQPFQPTPLSEDDDRFGLPGKARARAEALVADFAWSK